MSVRERVRLLVERARRGWMLDQAEPVRIDLGDNQKLDVYTFDFESKEFWKDTPDLADESTSRRYMLRVWTDDPTAPRFCRMVNRFVGDMGGGDKPQQDLRYDVILQGVDCDDLMKRVDKAIASDERLKGKAFPVRTWRMVDDG